MPLKRLSFIVLFAVWIFFYPDVRYKRLTAAPIQLRTALVIGNGMYKNAPIKNPVNDAQDMAKILENSGFNVILKTNATRQEMEKAIQNFGRTLRDGGVGLFYFAGHGLQINGHNYLVPIDAKIESESDVRYEAVDAGRVLGKMEDAFNDINIVILDACRNNPYSRSFRSAMPGLARMDAPKGSFIAYATAPGSVASDGEGRNGVFTKHLIESMQITGLTIEQVFKQVRIKVLEETHDQQIPWESSSLIGNFIFFDKKNNKNILLSDLTKIKPSLKPETGKKSRSRVSLMSGWWDTWAEKPARSILTEDKDGKKKWVYTIPDAIKDKNAGVNIFINSFSLSGNTIYVKIHSKRGLPIHVRAYSFVKGYSKKDDDETYLPAEIVLNLSSGLNEISINPKDLEIPEWWMDEHNHPLVKFSWDDIRILEFSAEFETNQYAISDTLKIYAVDFVEQ